VLKLTLPMQLLLMSTPFNVTWIQQSPECDIKRVWLYQFASKLADSFSKYPAHKFINN